MQTETPFSHFNLKPQLIESLNSMGFVNASPIQELTIGPILDDQDIFAQAETGSGKTGSFAIPIIEKILRDKQEQEGQHGQKTHYVILSPTRELAQQTNKVFTDLGNQSGITPICLIGGESFQKQKDELSENKTILVATPGRLVDLIKQKEVDISDCQTIVFDEADRLFDMGFKKDIEFVLNRVPKSRQLIMVSATNNMEVLETAYKFDSHPVELKLNEDSLLVDNIDHKLAMLSANEKMSFLVSLLRKYDDTYALIFCNTQLQTHVVAEWLKIMEFKAKPISGRLAQNKRTALLKDFRDKKTTVLVCTDVAARGLDIKDVPLVVNYELPQEAANYVHRIGRTGRAGSIGKAVSLVAHEDCQHLDAIYKLIETKIEKMDVQENDFAKDLAPKPHLDYKSLKITDRRDYAPRKDYAQKNDHGPKRDYEQKKGPRRSVIDNRRKKKISYDGPRAQGTRIPSLHSKNLTYTYKGVSPQEGQKKALSFFRVKDKSTLNEQVVSRGLPIFLLFGPRKMTINYQLKPIYKKILTPFLIKVIRLAKLDLFVQVYLKENTVRVDYSGEDVGLLLRNKAELLRSFEHLIKTYLPRIIEVPKDLKLYVSVRTDDQKSASTDEELLDLADKMKKKALETKQSVLLKPLNSHQRRIIHQHFGDDTLVSTSSKGEGRYKRVEIIPNPSA